MTRSILSGNRLKVILHIIVWAALFILPTYLVFSGSENDQRFMKEIWFQFVCYVIVFYLSYLLLAPRFFFTGKKLIYFISTALLVILFTISFELLREGLRSDFRNSEPERRLSQGVAQNPVPKQIHELPPAGRPPIPFRAWPVFNFMLTCCLVTGLSLGLRFSEKLVLNEKIRKEAEKEQLHTELAFLKHQINPHFLFNTLNSIYSLALIKSDLTAEAVMKLSDMMRYVIQDVEHETVPLELEMEYVIQYVELQRIRLSSNIDVQMKIEGDVQPYKIPPMILVPFIENAFKYGTSSHEQAVIGITLKIEDGFLSYKVHNRVFTGREQTGTFGIGIQNTRQRLNLIYPGKHKLTLTNDGKTFVVNLDISLT